VRKFERPAVGNKVPYWSLAGINSLTPPPWKCTRFFIQRFYSWYL